MIPEAPMQGVMGIALAVDGDLERRFAEMNVARRRGISQVVAAMLTERSANMVELGSALPREFALPVVATAAELKAGFDHDFLRIVGSPMNQARQPLVTNDARH